MMWAYRVGMTLRRFSFNRNPLRRSSDRIESGLLVAAVAMLIIAVPLATQANEAAYQSGLRAAAEASVSSVRTEAVVLENAPQLESSSSVRGPVTKPKVRVAWPAPDSTPREGLLEVAFGTKSGTRIPVWIDRGGSLTGAPPSLLDVRSRAIVTATVVVLGWVLILAVVLAIVRKVLDHFRLIAWGIEWETVERKWRRPTR